VKTMDEEDVNLKRVYAHQNAELDKRACFFFLYSRILFFFSPRLGFSNTKKKKLNKKRVFVFLLLLLLLLLLPSPSSSSDLQGLNEKRRELSDKIRQDALAMERLEKRVEENKKMKKQVENLIEQGVQAKRKILETSKHVLMHLKRESEAFFRESGAHGEQEDSY
jgi:hypothetical protein